MDRAFVDSAAFFALFDRTDANHAAALTARANLIAVRAHVFSTNFVLAETHALLLGRRGRTLAAALRALDQDPDTTFARVGIDDERRAREIIDRYDDKDFSLTDATRFAVMERLGITVAFTFDRHFAQFGFQLLGPEPQVG